ncbi:MAG: hypothetical protein V4532_16015 [Pseudomonadota bacterium]
MTRKQLLTGLLAVCCSTVGPVALQNAHAAEPKAAAAAKPADMPMYGSQLMTEKERTEFRARMWAAQTDEERSRLRTEHHEDMKKRAQAQGMTLPDMPPDAASGVGPRGGMGSRHGMRRGRAMDPSCAASAPPCAASGPYPGKRMHRRMGY